MVSIRINIPAYYSNNAGERLGENLLLLITFAAAIIRKPSSHCCGVPFYQLVLADVAGVIT